MGDHVTNANLFDKVENIRLELKGDIVRLEGKFDVVVNTEITKLRDELNTLKVRYATMATKLGVLGFIAASITGAIVSVIVAKVLK